MRLDEVFPMIIGFGLVVGIPITAILTNHQRKMAELIHGKTGDHTSHQATQALLYEIQSLRYEMQELKESVNQQRIDMDDIKSLTNRFEANDRDIMNSGS